MAETAVCAFPASQKESLVTLPNGGTPSGVGRRARLTLFAVLLNNENNLWILLTAENGYARTR